MMIKDYEEKKQYALDFYEQATEVYRMVHDSIRGFQYLYGYNLYNEDLSKVTNKEKQALIERRRRQLLIELGRVGEYAIKYLLLMQQIHNYPNQTFEEFKNKTIYSIGEKGVRNTYINQYHMDSTIIEEILVAKEQHKLQPLHDYSYLFTILEKIYPSVVNNIQDNLLFNIKSESVLEDCSLPNDITSLISFFSNINFLVITELTQSDKELYVEDYKRILEQSGDSFTKLRYLENNIEDKQYNMNEIIYLLYYLIDFIELVHNYNHDNPEKDIKIAYLKKKIANFMLPQGLRKYDEHPKFEELLQQAEQKFNIISNTLDKHPKIIDNIDYVQLATWNQFDGTGNIYENAISNFMTNILIFSENEIILNNFPLLLPNEHLLEIAKFLEGIGLDPSTLKLDESNLLCIPVHYLKSAYAKIKDTEVSPQKLISTVNQIINSQEINDPSIPSSSMGHK